MDCCRTRSTWMATPGPSPPARLSRSRCAQPATVLTTTTTATALNTICCPTRTSKPCNPSTTSQLDLLHSSCPRARHSRSASCTLSRLLTHLLPLCQSTTSTPTLPIPIRTAWLRCPPQDSSWHSPWQWQLLQNKYSVDSALSALDLQLPTPGPGQIANTNKSFIHSSPTFPASLQATPGPG